MVVDEEKDKYYELLLKERILLIRRVITQEHEEDEFCMSWSGGKDSCVMSRLVDMALPDNKIPRVYADTGLDLAIMRSFIQEQKSKDNRIVIITPTVNIKTMLNTEGYPFASKRHSATLDKYQRSGLNSDWVKHYIGQHEDGVKWKGNYGCPKVLRYQFSPSFKIRVSDKCCDRMKEHPIDQWAKNNGYKYHIIGLMSCEGGRRQKVGCFAFSKDRFVAFQPLAPLTKEWEEWFIEKYNISICDIYKPPFNYERTGCKGCPFSKHLQKELDTLKEHFPKDYEQCESLWKPVYDEYRRIGYRLKGGKDEKH